MNRRKIKYSIVGERRGVWERIITTVMIPDAYPFAIAWGQDIRQDGGTTVAPVSWLLRRPLLAVPPSFPFPFSFHPRAVRAEQQQQAAEQDR